MADVENQPDSSFPVKRKPDLCCGNVANKAQKLNNPPSSSADSESVEVQVNASGVENLSSSSTDGKIGTESSISLEEASNSVSEKDENVDLAAEEKQEDEEEIDRKGKGISREDKGKGKLIEFDESDDSDDDDDDDEDGIDESDLSEVDLDSILPSRTRRRSILPGVYISNDLGGEATTMNDDSDA